MIAYPKLHYLLLLLLSLASCGTPEPSPEEVLVTYVQLVNQGQLEAARQWCTPAGVAHLEALETIMEASGEALDSSTVRVDVIHCEPQAAGLHCEVQIDDGFGPHTEFYDLLQTPQGWRVDQAAATGPTQTREEIVPPEQDSRQ